MSRVSIRSALTETFSAPGFAATVAVLALVYFVAWLLADWPFQILALIATTYVFGYAVSFSRTVALSPAVSMPRLLDAVAHLRRGASLTVVVVLPLFVVAFPLSGLGFLAGLIAGDAGEYASILAGVAIFPIILGIVVLSEVPVGARYLYFDRLTDGINYVAALRMAWSTRRLIAAPILFSLAVQGLLWLLAVYVGRFFGRGGLRGLPQKLLPLFRGDFSGKAIALLASIAVISLLTAVCWLVVAHVVGQYAKLAYGAPGDIEVGPTKVSSGSAPRT